MSPGYMSKNEQKLPILGNILEAIYGKINIEFFFKFTHIEKQDIMFYTNTFIWYRV